MVEDSAGKHDLHMLAASWPAGSGLPKVCVSHHRRGWEWPRCLEAETEGHLAVLERGRKRMQSESGESLSMLPSGPRVVSWSLVKAVKRADVLVDVHDLFSSSLTVVHLAAEQPETLAPRRAMLDVSVGACSSMPRHTLQPLA